MPYYRKHCYQQEHLFDPYLQIHSNKFVEPIEKDDDIFRILCLGGSTTLCGDLPEAKSYPDVLEKKLQHYYPSLKIEVLNGGMYWYATKHSLINYASYCRRWQPNLVIVMHAINDLYRSFSPPEFAVGDYNDNWSHFYGPSIKGARPEPFLTFEQHLCKKCRPFLKKLVNMWYAGLVSKKRVIYIDEPEPILSSVDFPIERYVSLSMFKEHLEGIVKYVKVDASDVLILTMPSLYKETMSEEEISSLWFGRSFCCTQGDTQLEFASYKSLYIAMRAFNKAAERIALSENAFFADMANAIPKNLKYLKDDCHYTKKGAKLLGESVAKIIVKFGIMNFDLSHGE